MPTIHAIFENGVFRPVEPVELPAGARVEFEPRLTQGDVADGHTLGNGQAPDTASIYTILEQSVETGVSDLAARHNEHQP
ncbi:hypothetical protein Mal64_32880 [Pseudobythopirellula maris]|uniref:DUF104 domain-containing protein n=1 Tax=Pseudobythopirellula maris TaxID=2527991 RepID=A0A5C5ZKR8_9BACT|nr:antitoxin family protein [Pseudobythopirellula maris]TWT87745.1 hypothetical protein Mal64_32880 [Pseudobythopirellula maris]